MFLDLSSLEPNSMDTVKGGEGVSCKLTHALKTIQFVKNSPTIECPQDE